MQNIFTDEEIKAICSIPLSIRTPPDRLIWHYEKNGNFSVNSAYHRARVWLQPSNGGASSSNSNSNSLWVWNAKVPPKVKVCVWKLANEFVPTRVNLTKRHLGGDMECVMCCSQRESTAHLMAEFAYAKCAWMSSTVGVPMRNRYHSSFVVWLDEMGGLIPISSFDMVLMICWALWGARNTKLWQGKCDHPEVCVSRAVQWWLGYNKCGNSDLCRPKGQIVDRWLTPPIGYLKLNTDGSWSDDKKRAGFGAVIRDDQGVFVAAKCGMMEDAFSPIQAEAMAIRESMLWAVQRGIQKLALETDSLQIVEALRDSSLNVSAVGQIVEDIKVLLQSITKVVVTHTRRKANSIAHRLARIGLTLTQSCEWDTSPPSVIIDELVKECSL